MKGTGSLSACLWLDFFCGSHLAAFPPSLQIPTPANFLQRLSSQSAQSGSGEATRRNGKNLAAITSMGSIFTKIYLICHSVCVVGEALNEHSTSDRFRLSVYQSPPPLSLSLNIVTLVLSEE